MSEEPDDTNVLGAQRYRPDARTPPNPIGTSLAALSPCVTNHLNRRAISSLDVFEYLNLLEDVASPV